MKKTIIKSLLELQTWWESEYRPIMAFDTETSSLNYLSMDWIGCSFATDTAACYIDLMYPGDISRYCLQEFFNDIELLIMHNAVFDLKVLYKYGVKPNDIFCTLTTSKLVNENLPSYSLKHLAHTELEVPESEIKSWEEASKFGQDNEQFADYAMNDSIWAYQLYEKLNPELKKQDLEHLFYQVEMPFQYVLRDMEINGIAVNKEELENGQNIVAGMLCDTENEIFECIDMEFIEEFDEKLQMVIVSSPINLASTNQVSEVIRNLGFEVAKTKKKNDSVDQKYLKTMLGKHPFFDLLYKYRKLSTLDNTFLSKIGNMIDKDGRVRPSYNMVRTGRLSCSKPNLQNQPNPKKEKLVFNYRKIFVPGD